MNVKCGCKIDWGMNGINPSIIFCPLHKATAETAEERDMLRDALRKIAGLDGHITDMEVRDVAYAALAAAEGR